MMRHEHIMRANKHYLPIRVYQKPQIQFAQIWSCVIKACHHREMRELSSYTLQITGVER